jgi:SAM-dependent methyltransferase
MTSSSDGARAMFGAPPPQWSLKRPKPIWQSLWDLTGAPLRMVALPDVTSERLHLTSLRAERLGVVLPLIRGRLLDIGAGDNMLVNLHRERAIGSPGEAAAKASVGVDVVDWGADCLIVDNCRHLPVESNTFDTVSFVACLNHIPEREEAMREAVRALRPGGRVIATMIGKLIGDIGHAIWWYSEDKHRSIAEGEVMGMDPGDVLQLMRSSGLADVKRFGFVYGLNHCFVGTKPGTVGD